jgi:hypothetical protein
MSELIINQDLFESKQDFDTFQELVQIIILEFPHLKPDVIQVVARATINHIKQGIVYPKEIQKMIQIVSSKILSN